jgi:hypothetical protein
MPMVDIYKASIDRIDLSKQVITAWEAMGGPSGTPAELLKMIAAEIAELDARRADDDERVSGLIERYQALAGRLRASVT